jgi:hypothetical protein
MFWDSRQALTNLQYLKVVSYFYCGSTEILYIFMFSHSAVQWCLQPERGHAAVDSLMHFSITACSLVPNSDNNGQCNNLGTFFRLSSFGRFTESLNAMTFLLIFEQGQIDRLCRLVIRVPGCRTEMYLYMLCRRK